MKKLTDDEIAKGLTDRPGWRREAQALIRTFELPSFARAVAVVGEVAQHADAVDHHPDMLIQFRKVTFTLSTHDAGGISRKDFELAAAIDRLAK